MPSALESLAAELLFEQKAGEEAPGVEVVEGRLCSVAELRRAVLAGALLSGLVSVIAGVGVGYLLGLRDGRDG
ncbi:hypothetical protein SAMN02745121_07003 [Nannocystis exedens]|uniref:Uncharacterized protein n=1 Tax=Nannocystis exedens TaxID=54 RepID=A0A1I2G2M9_9BACT|nr:hypothetical protein [Nannocystis exedens]SFF11247.1 hypothetical protein SAMN02745121_07003 [Nannocystis exedens]